MKIVDFGSLNIDKVYGVKEIVKQGETITALSLETFTGGKGLNQSVAASRAGADCVHAGAIGPDGAFLEEYLASAGVDTSSLLHVGESTGHAIIQVNQKGQNSIIVCGGANHRLTREYIDGILDKCENGDVVLLQNETNEVAYIIEEAHSKGLKVVWNPSPFPEDVSAFPCSSVDVFIVNEIEAAQLAGVPSDSSFSVTLDSLVKKYPQAQVVMTLGGAGVFCQWNGEKHFHDIYKVEAVDTTAAGDTFCGYFLSSLSAGKDIDVCLELASAASAIAVSRKGASPSIPTMEEVVAFLASRRG